MYLKRLDLQGFKSFPEKVKLEFHQGITAVVGPNGSGKSNVSDAVRWVLGEQRAKSLRGEKMEDIIFAGTESRKPLGFAEVSILLDNEDGRMPLDFSEVQVTRRVYRSGESEYLINGTACRLKDIHELFMDTGIGKEGYSIIGQGKIDEILSSKGEERRRIFEEAAGIVKFKTRRMEAGAKLEKERQNLQRVEDIIGELELQLQPLEEQSKVATAYLGYQEALKHAEISMFCTDADRLKEACEGFLQKEETVQSQLQQTQEQMETTKAESARLQAQAAEISVKIRERQEAVTALKTEMERTEGNIRLSEEQKQNDSDHMVRLQTEKQQKEEKIKANREELRLVVSKADALRFSMEEQQKKLTSLEEKNQSLHTLLQEKGEKAESFKDEIFEQIRISTEAKGEISKKEAMMEQFLARKAQLAQELELAEGRQHDQQIHLEVLEQAEREAQQKAAYLQKELDALEKDRLQAEEQLQKKEKELQQQEIFLFEGNSRLNLLTELEKEHEGFYGSVKALLKWKESGNHNICGAIGELLKVEEQYETAIEAALGGALQNIVTETEDDAKNAIRYLKEHRLGRATFLPVSAIQAKPFGAGLSVLEEPAVIGLASDLVECEEKYRRIVGYLLGRILIVDGLDAAVMLAKKYRHQYKMVTLEGDIMNPGGAMSGGSAAKKTANIFGRTREIRSLQEALAKAEKETERLREQVSLASEDLEEIKESSLERMMEMQKQHLSADSDLEEKERTKEAIDEWKERIRLFYVEQDQLEVQIAAAQEDIVQNREQIRLAEQAVAQANARLESFQSGWEEEKNKQEELLQEVTDCRVRLSADAQALVAQEEQRTRIEREAAQLAKEVQALEESALSYAQSRQARAEEQKTLSKRLEKLCSQQQEAENAWQKEIAMQEETTQKAKEYDQLVLEQTETVANLHNELFRLQSGKERAEAERNQLFERFWDEYEMTYQAAKEYAQNEEKPYHVLKSTAKELRGKMKALGAVNVAAIEQYREVKERYGFLTTQKADILEAEQKLMQIIDELSVRMEEQFTKQFAVISQNFNEVFQEMFGGGKAYLKLTDQDNVLESGIDIIAQPPGKSLQNMQLLSGGERALTAIAILFSILRMKPSPFCILDEIEAALDDANVTRFAKYLTNFSKDTQFIVITHRKGTMEYADVMYGVTMQEKGVSKLLSVDFAQKNETA